MDERVIHQKESLQRSRAQWSRGSDHVGIRAVEYFHQRMLLLPLLHEINASLVCIVNRKELFVLSVVPITLRREWMFTTHRAVQRTAHRKSRISDFFGTQPAPAKLPKEIVVYIDLCIAEIVGCCQLISV